MNKSQVINDVYHKLPMPFRDNVILKLFGLLKIPLLSFCSPQVIELNEHKCVIKIPLKRKTKNHLGSMYFGVLACGADCAAGLGAMKQIILSGHNISLAFKDFKAEFYKRPMEDVYFSCTQGQEISQFVKKVIESDQRELMPVEVIATAPKQFGQEPVARFTLGLSLKKK